jgi:DNA polymerase alpha-associated DNA helicase A
MSAAFTPATPAELRRFVDRQKALLAAERAADAERAALLLTRASPRALEDKGLAIGALGVAGVGVGLGGKTCAALSGIIIAGRAECRDAQADRARAPERVPYQPRLPAAHLPVRIASPASHTKLTRCRNGDIARVEEHVSSSGGKQAKAKAKKAADAADGAGAAVEGVVYKARDRRETIRGPSH